MKVVMMIVIQMTVHKRYVLIYNCSIQNAVSIKNLPFLNFQLVCSVTQSVHFEGSAAVGS